MGYSLETKRLSKYVYVVFYNTPSLWHPVERIAVVKNRAVWAWTAWGDSVTFSSEQRKYQDSTTISFDARITQYTTHLPVDLYYYISQECIC